MPIDPEAAPQTRCVQAVGDVVRGLIGPGRPLGPRPTLFERKWEGNHTNVTFPAVVVSHPGPLAETYAPGTNAADDIGYPVRVAVFDSDSQFDDERAGLYEGWRHTLGRAFHQQPLPGVPESLWCLVEPFVILEYERDAFQHVRSGLVVRCWLRVPVGLT